MDPNLERLTWIGFYWIVVIQTRLKLGLKVNISSHGIHEFEHLNIRLNLMTSNLSCCFVYTSSLLQKSLSWTRFTIT